MKNSKGRLIAIRIVIPIVLILLVIGGGVIWQSTLTPTFTEAPTVALPSPNAYDYIAAAGAMIKDPFAVGWAGEASPMPIDASVTPAQIADWDSGYHTFTPLEKEVLVAENQPAIDEFESGIKYPCMSPTPRPPSRITGQRSDLVRLLFLAGECKEARGDWSGAMNDYIDIVALAVDISRGTDLLGSLRGDGFEGLIRKSIFTALGHLSAAQSENAARRLSELDSMRPQPYEVLIEEKQYSDENLKLVLADKSWRQEFAGIWSDSHLVGNVIPHKANAIETFSLRIESARTAYATFNYYIDQLIAYYHRPWQPHMVSREPSCPDDIVSQVYTGLTKMISVTYRMPADDRRFRQYLCKCIFGLDSLKASKLPAYTLLSRSLAGSRLRPCI